MKKPEKINILIVCEESQAICKAFRKRGFNAYSCDLKKCSGGHPEWHFADDALKIIREKGGYTQETTNRKKVKVLKWDLVIAHPPCTYLSTAGEGRFNPEKNINWKENLKEREDALNFFKACLEIEDVEHVACENPQGYVNGHYKQPTQTIDPFYFGDENTKRTCLWLKNLPCLVPTKFILESEKRGTKFVWKKGQMQGRFLNNFMEAGNVSNDDLRRELRSKTFPGVADAIAQQWGDFLLGLDKYQALMGEYREYIQDIEKEINNNIKSYEFVLNTSTTEDKITLKYLKALLRQEKIAKSRILKAVKQANNYLKIGLDGQYNLFTLEKLNFKKIYNFLNEKLKGE